MIEIDIILPIYKPDNNIYEAIVSIINQTYQYWHLFIIDDNSKDNRLEEVKGKYANFREKISYFQFNKNRRAAACRNFAINQGNGKYIAFIDQDDIWIKDKLKLQVEYLEKTGFDCVHGNVLFINNNNEFIQTQDSSSENESRQCINWEHLTNVELAKKIFNCPNIRLISSMISRKCFIKIGGFKEQFFGGEDEIFWFEIAFHYKIGFINDVLFYRREHNSNTFHRYRIDRLYGYLGAIKYLNKNYPSIIKKLYRKKYCDIGYSLIQHLRLNKKFINLFNFSLLFFLMHPIFVFKKISIWLFKK